MGHRVKTAVELTHCDGLWVQHSDLDLLLIGNALLSAGGEGGRRQDREVGESTENVWVTSVSAENISAAQ